MVANRETGTVRAWLRWWRPYLAIGAVVLVGVVGASWMVGGPHGPDSYIAQVTALGPRLCVATGHLEGDCFIDVNPAIVAKLHIGQCVRVTPEPGAKPNTVRLRSLKTLDSKAHRTACPTGR